MKRWTWTIVSLVLGLAVLAGGVYLTQRWKPPPMPATVEEAIVLMTSPGYQRLTQPQKQRYVERLSELAQAMPAQQRAEVFRKAMRDESSRPAMREAMTSMMLEQARSFVAGDAATRQRLVDQALAAGAMMRRGGGGGPRPEGPGPSNEDRPARQGDPDRRAEMKQWIQDRIERGNPQQQAYMFEYMRAVRQRREDSSHP